MADASDVTKTIEGKPVCDVIVLPATGDAQAETNGSGIDSAKDDVTDDSYFDDADPMASVNVESNKELELSQPDEVEYDQLEDSQAEEEEDEMHEEYVDDGHEIDGLVDDEQVDESEPGEEEEDEFVDDEEIDDVGDDSADDEAIIPTPVDRPPTQVPKKRKPAAVLDDIDATEQKNDNAVDQKTMKKKIKLEDFDEDSSEAKGAKFRAGAHTQDEVREDQCRVCTAQDKLIGLFVKVVKNSTPAEMLHIICPNISIASKDFMPQFICQSCLERVKNAIELKTQCETTENELRKKLSRSKNKVRRPTGFVTIDAPLESEQSDIDEEEFASDLEFKVTDEGSLTADDDSADSDFSTKRKPRGRPSGGKRGRPRVHPNMSLMKGDSKYKIDGEDLRSSLVKKKLPRPKSPSGGDTSPTEFPCNDCDQVFTRKLSLVLHRKTHISGRDIINCELCDKQFKMKGAFRTHMAKHKANAIGYKCKKCNKILPDKDAMQRHNNEVHDGNVVYRCARCQRTFVSRLRLQRHQDGHCHGNPVGKNRRTEYETYAMGKDLFKAVAPMTTTYWSDSFSE